MNAIRIFNVEARLPTLEDARRQVIEEIKRAKRERVKVLKVTRLAHHFMRCHCWRADGVAEPLGYVRPSVYTSPQGCEAVKTGAAADCGSFRVARPREVHGGFQGRRQQPR